MAQKRRARRILPEWSGDPEDLYDYARPPAPRAGPAPLLLAGPIAVTNDWPEIVPIPSLCLQSIERGRERFLNMPALFWGVFHD
jgi:hypothetical protein